MHENLALSERTWVRKQGEMALGKNKTVLLFLWSNLSCILQSRNGYYYRESQYRAPWKFSEWINSRLRILSRTRSRATQESSEEIFAVFILKTVLKHSNTFVFFNAVREWPKHLHLNNTLPSGNYKRNSSGLNKLTQKKTRPRKSSENSPRLYHSVFWSASLKYDS